MDRGKSTLFSAPEDDVELLCLLSVGATFCRNPFNFFVNSDNSCTNMCETSGFNTKEDVLDNYFSQVRLLCVFTCVSSAEARLSYSRDVCPSVSVTRWYCIKTAERIVMLSSPHDSPFILFLCISRSSRNSDGVTPCMAAKQRWGVKISQFSTNNLLYLRNG